MSLSVKQQLSQTLAADYSAWLAGQPPTIDIPPVIPKPRPAHSSPAAKVSVSKRVRPKAPPKPIYRDGKQVAALLLSAKMLRDGAIDSRPLLHAIMGLGLSDDSARHFIGRAVKKGWFVEHPYSACRGIGRVIALAEHVGTIGAAAESIGHRAASEFFADWLAVIGQDWIRATQLPRHATLQVLVDTLKNMVARGLLESSYRPNNRNQIVMHYRLARV